MVFPHTGHVDAMATQDDQKLPLEALRSSGDEAAAAQTKEPREPAEAEGNSPTVPLVSRPGLIPIFALCSIVTAVGFYAAMTGEETRGVVQSEEHVELLRRLLPEGPLLDPPSEVFDVSGEPVRFASRAFDERARRRYTLSQRVMRAGRDDGAHTTLSVVAEHAPMKGELTERVKLRDLSLTIVDKEGRPYAPSIARQLERRVGGSGFDLTRHKAGVPSKLVWTDETNSKMAPVLEIIESGVFLLSVSLPDRPVRAGESWTYSVPLAGLEVQGVKMSGAMNVKATFRGTKSEGAQDLYIIEQELMLALRGELRDEASQPIVYALDGQGRGLMEVQASSSEVHAHHVILEASTMLSGGSGGELTRAFEYDLRMAR